MFFIREWTFCGPFLFPSQRMLQDQVITAPQQRFRERAPVPLSYHIRWSLRKISLLFPLFRAENMLQSQARCKQGFFFLSGLSVVRFWFSKQWSPFSTFLVLSFPFADVYLQCIGVTELNAKRAPCCVPPSTGLPSPGHRDGSYLILEMTFLYSPSKIEFMSIIQDLPLPITMSMDLNFLLTLGWEGYLFDSSEQYFSLLYRKVYFPRNFPCAFRPNLTFLS